MIELAAIFRALCCGARCCRGTDDTGPCVAEVYGRAIHGRAMQAGLAIHPAHLFAKGRQFLHLKPIRDGHPCPACRRPMLISETRPLNQKARWATVDHTLSRRHGGTSNPENLRWLCLTCNSLLPELGDCIGAMAAAVAVTGRQPAANIRAWWRRTERRRTNQIEAA